MRWLSDQSLDRLRGALDDPDLGGTKYRLVGFISRGGMGAVYRVFDSELEREVALKVLAIPDPTESDVARMRREAHILARLEHPSIVPIHDAGTLADGRAFYVMKWVRGVRLDERVPASVDEAISVVERVAEAIAFAHAHGVIHRDLKPENVMVGEFGEVLVLDWGVARSGSEETPGPVASPPADASAPPRATAPGTILGTPAYMAPEQARGDLTAIGPRTDVYGLGALLLFLLSGHPPAAADDGGRRPLPPALPKALAAITAKALNPEPALRYASARELQADLARFRARSPVSAHRETFVERSLRLAGKYRTPIVIIVAYLVMRALLLIWLRR